jgi:hypothetical protein
VLNLSLSRHDIKALDHRTAFVGKHFRSTKSKTTWSFNVKLSCYTVELLTSSLSGKKRVKVNGNFVAPSKSGTKKNFDTIMKNEAGMKFSVDGIQIEVMLGPAKKTYDLLINGHSFSALNEQRISKITDMLRDSAKKVPVFAAQLAANNPDKQSNQHVLQLSAADLRSGREVRETSQEGTRSSRLSSRQLRRSDASVKDINTKDLSIAGGSSHRTVRGFRRSDASVRDVASLTRNSSVRGFRRSDASVRDISLEMLRAEEATEREFSGRSNFDDSSAGLTSAGLSLCDGLFESIPSSDGHPVLSMSTEPNDGSRVFMYSDAIANGATNVSPARDHIENKMHQQNAYVNVNAVQP